MNRKLLGRWTSAISRVRVYELPDSLEIEANEQFEVTRRRVFLEDVQLVTFHRRRGIAYLLVTGAIAAIAIGFTLFGLSIGAEMAWTFGIMFGFAGVPALASFLVRAIFGLDIITVFGRRSKLAIRFRIRKKRALEVYEHVCQLVHESQQRRAAEYAAEEAPVTTSEEAPPLPPEDIPTP